MRRATLRALLLAAIVAASGWGVALEVQTPGPVAALPGSYATLPLRLAGEGTFDYVVSAPAPWVPLSAAGSVRVDGQGFMSVTLRVPRSALAGSSADVEVTFTARDDPTRSSSVSLSVEVAPLVALDVIAPADLEGRLDEALRFSVVVRNAGNQADRFSIRASQPMWSSRLEPDEVALEPGEEREVTVVLEPVGQVSSGYRMTVRFEVVSHLDPDARARASSRVVLRRAGDTGATERTDAPPALTLSLRGGVSAGLSVADGEASGRVGYDLLPRLTGELSDFVDVTAGIGGFAGDLDDPFATLPSQLDVALRGGAWNAAGSLAPGRFGVSGGTEIGDWRVGGGTNLSVGDESLGYGVNAFAASSNPDLDLQFSARVAGAGESRTDGVAARYRRPLADGVDLTVGADLVGSTSPDGYRIEPVVRQSVTWQAQAFDLTQSYTAAPLAGLHTFGVSGGPRLLGPVGVRGSSSLQLTAGDHRWRNALTLTARPAPDLGTTLSVSTSSSGASASWTVRPAATYRISGDGWSGGVGASYAYTGVLRGDGAIGSAVRANASARIADFSVGASGAYEARSGPEVHERRLSVDADAGYRIGTAATLGAGVRYRLELDGAGGVVSTEQAYEAVWQQRWTSDVSSRTTYAQSVRQAASTVSRSERLSVTVNARDVGVDGLSLSAGYAASSSSGLFTGIAPIRHDLSVRAGYTLHLPFATPDTVVELFGGRRGAAIEGVVFLDRDLDGRRGDGEPGLAGVTVRVGAEETVTDEDGRYRLRVPAGQQRVSVGAGLPAAVAARGPSSVVVTDGVDQRLDLPFVPVVTLSVALFDDLDGDGLQGAGEPGLAFGGVVIEGPEERSVRLGGRGTADVTGLVPGRYTVRPDPDRLPPRYVITTEPVVVTLREGERPARVVVGAGAPPRTTLTTFSGVELALIARAEPTRAAPGADVAVQALVSGPAERVVVVSVDGSETVMTQEGSRWNAVVRLPRDAPLGSATMLVRAEAPGTQTEGRVQLTLAERPLAQAERLVAMVGHGVMIRVTTAFAADEVRVEAADRSIVLESVDGYAWIGEWSVDASVLDHVSAAADGEPLRLEARIVVDGEALGSIRVEVRAGSE